MIAIIVPMIILFIFIGIFYDLLKKYINSKGSFLTVYFKHDS